MTEPRENVAGLGATFAAEQGEKIQARIGGNALEAGGFVLSVEKSLPQHRLRPTVRKLQ
jgi:hypothetical protein